jgi:hypothetical protein
MNRIVFLCRRPAFTDGRFFGHVLPIPSSAISDKRIECKQSIARYGQD